MNPFEWVEAGLMGLHPWQEVCAQLRLEVGQKTDEHRAWARLAQRTAIGFQGWEHQRSGGLDIAILLRHFIRQLRQQPRMRLDLHRRLSRYYERCGLSAIQDGDGVRVTAQPVYLPLLGSTDQWDTLEFRRNHDTVIGDGMLKRMTGYSHYINMGQKAAIYATLQAPSGSTTLITLTTGAGKSLCITLPAWFRSQGGQTAQGTTIVVVPTVALAIDQERHAQRYFERAQTVEYRPMRLSGDTSPEARARIYNAIRNGTLPILYTSPEALLQSHLHDVCLEAARHGFVPWFVIDEAHLVETWGASFRTEFQFLAAYQRNLHAASGGTLRTLLLSATMTVFCQRLLEELFGSTGEWQEVHSLTLRAEPGYWILPATDQADKRAKILGALPFLPRPLIFYVAIPDHATTWEAILREEGYRRVATFTGETRALQRTERIRLWNEEMIDIIIATSAFGVGIDKPDVRAVLHACVPENMDRFYQEVGRGGRDGFNSVSLLCTVREDSEIPTSMSLKARITVEKASSRWRGMRLEAVPHPDDPDVLVLDLQSAPTHNPDALPGDTHREWNEHTLLLLFRAGFIDIVDVPIPAFLIENSRLRLQDRPYLEPALRCIRVLRPDITNDDDTLERELSGTREDELRRTVDAVKLLSWEIIQRYSAPKGNTPCLGTVLRRLYPHCELACGGCPVCRLKGTAPYQHTPPVVPDLVPTGNPVVALSPHLHDLLIQPYTARWSSEQQRDDTWIPLIMGLLRHGVRQIIVPEAWVNDQRYETDVLTALGNVPFADTIHYLYTDIHAIRYPHLLYLQPTAVFYSSESNIADRLLQVVQHHLKRIPLVQVVPAGLHLATLRGTFEARAEGQVESVKAFLHVLERQRYDLF